MGGCGKHCEKKVAEKGTNAREGSKQGGKNQRKDFQTVLK